MAKDNTTQKGIQKTDGRVAWSFFIRGYLDSATLNLESIIDFLKKYPKRKLILRNSNSSSNAHYGAYLVYKRDLWIPTIFLIRHSIELIIKSLSIHLYSEFAKHHDISKLLEGIKKADKSKKFLQEDIVSFSHLCRKYFLYEFFPKSIVSQPSYIDTFNILFRYPENYQKNEELIRINDFTFFNDINVTETRKFLQDVKRLRDLYSSLETTPSYIESQEKFGIPVKQTKNRVREIRKEKKERQKNSRFYSL